MSPWQVTLIKTTIPARCVKADGCVAVANGSKAAILTYAVD